MRRTARLAPLALAALLAARPAAAVPALAAVAADDRLRVHVGEWPGGAAQPRFTEVMIRDPGGAWSEPSLLPEPRLGLPFLHRDLTWFAEERVDRTGTKYHALLPVTGEPGTLAVRLERGQDLQGAAVLALDDWTFVVSEIAGSRVLSRVITSHGSALEMEVQREISWSPGWPAGTRLLATGAAGDAVVVVGSDASTVHAAAHDGGPHVLPDLPLEGGEPVAACVTSRGPVVAAGRGARLVAWELRDGAWREAAAIPLPGGSRLAAITASPLGKDRRSAALVGRLEADEPVIVATVIGDEGPSALERQVLRGQAAPDAAIRPPAERPSLAEVERRAVRLSRLRWALVLVTFPILVLLLHHLARLSRRA